MNKPSEPHAPLRPGLTSPLLPALLVGMTAALLLSVTGFGMGCLYETAFAAPAAVSGAPAAAAMAMGGPEETAEEESAEPAPLPVVPLARQAAPVSAGATGGTLEFSRPVVGGWVSSSYGRRVDPFSGLPAVHRGVDFAGLDNTAILAVAPGVVSDSGRQRGYGNFIEIDHGRGWVTRYGHNAFNLVTLGDYVKPGQTIALMGSTGRTTGTHLHFEVLYNGRHRNPARLLPQDT